MLLKLRTSVQASHNQAGVLFYHHHFSHHYHRVIMNTVIIEKFSNHLSILRPSHHPQAALGRMVAKNTQQLLDSAQVKYSLKEKQNIFTNGTQMCITTFNSKNIFSCSPFLHFSQMNHQPRSSNILRCYLFKL